MIKKILAMLLVGGTIVVGGCSSSKEVSKIDDVAVEPIIEEVVEAALEIVR